MKHELIILQGIQGSGKTTWAKNWVKEDPKHRVRFNQDDIRNMFGVYWIPSRESLVKAMHNSFLNEAMLEGYDIVLDNMNLNQKTLNEIKEIVEEFNKWVSLTPVDLHYDIKYQTFFDVPLSICIERDKQRDLQIGEKVIRGSYEKYKDIYPLNGD